MIEAGGCRSPRPWIARTRAAAGPVASTRTAWRREKREEHDKELVLKAGLEGRISIQFVISPQGQVASSVLQSSTMSNLSVEKCVVDAVKRWEFPKPTGGGIAIVAYPFNFVAGSGG